MASKITSNFIKSRAAQRGYAAAAAAAAPKAAAGLQVTQLQNGALVASIENQSPLSRVSVFVRGGTSTSAIPGASTVFKAYATEGFSTPNHTGLHLVRLQESCGITLDVEGDRELLGYHGVANRDNVHHLFSIMSNVTNNNQYRTYECPVVNAWPNSVDLGPRNHSRLMAIQAARSAEANAVDLAFKAAFRSQPLGTSEVVPDYLYGKLTAEMVNDFVSASHGSAGVVVVGTGIDHSILLEGAATFGVPSGGVAAKDGSKYLGGDARVDAGGDLAHVVIAGEAVSYASRAASLVAAELLSNSSPIPNGSNSSAINAAAHGAATKGISQNYASTGLLGVYFSASADQVAAVSSSIAGFLRKFSASDKEVAAAKMTVKAAHAGAVGAAEAAQIGADLLHTGDCVDFSAAVDKVTAADVAQVIAKAFGGKLSVAAYGNVNNVPYSDSI